MTGHQSVYIKFFTISPEYNEDIEMCLRAYHLITINSSEESKFQIKEINPKSRGIITDNRQKQEAKDDKKADKNDRQCSHFQSDKTMKKKKKKKMMT